MRLLCSKCLGTLILAAVGLDMSAPARCGADSFVTIVRATAQAKGLA